MHSILAPLDVSIGPNVNDCQRVGVSPILMFDSLFAFFFAGMPDTRLPKNPFSHRTNTCIQHRSRLTHDSHRRIDGQHYYSRLTINPPVMEDIFRVDQCV